MNLPGLEIQQLLQNLQQIGGQLQSGNTMSSSFSGVMKHTLKTFAAHQDSSKMTKSELLVPNIKGLKAPALIRRLRRYLMSRGISLDDVVADDAGLKALKDFLNSAGFNSLEVDTLLTDLKEKSSRHGVKLSELVSRLEELANAHEGEPEAMLEIASLPFIESIISQLIKDPNTQQKVWDGVIKDGKGIRLSKLIANLRAIVQASPDDGKALPDEASRAQIAKLMEDLGIPADKGSMTLHRFVHELEALAAKAPHTMDEKRMDLGSLNAFIENLQRIKDPRAGADRFHLTGNTKTAALQNLRAEAPGRTIPETKATIPNAELQKMMETIGEQKPLAEVVKTAENQPNATAPTQPPVPKTPAGTLPAYVAHQVGRQIIQSHRNGNQDIQLQLKPPHLGRVQVNIDASGGGIRVNIITEHQAAQEMLMSHANDLKSTLMEQGLKLEKIDIQFDQFFDQSLWQQRQESNKTAGRRQRKSGFPLNRDPEDSREDTTVERVVASEGILDLVA